MAHPLPASPSPRLVLLIRVRPWAFLPIARPSAGSVRPVIDATCTEVRS